MPILLGAFDSQPKSALLEIFSTALLSDFRTQPFLPVLRKAIAHVDIRIRRLAFVSIINRIPAVLSQEAEQYESSLQTDPDDVILRILLLCYYSASRCSLFEEARRSRQRHLLWLIDNHPGLLSLIGPFSDLDPLTEGAQCYLQAKESWYKRIENDKDNTTLLTEMARFLSHQEPTVAEGLYKKAITLEPNNPSLREQMAGFYKGLLYTAKNLHERLAIAKKSLTEFEVALSLESNQLNRFHLRLKIAELAFEADELDKARQYADEILRETNLPGHRMYNDGSAIHRMHTVLGRLALKKGCITHAKWHLIESGKTIGSPVLKSFGPNMKLAKELLDLNEREVVIQYLHLCSIFWLSTDHAVERWIYIIERGGIPDFSPNL